MLVTKPTSLASDIETYKTLLSKVIAEKQAPIHPAFGPMSHSEWCKLIAIHSDHHFKQFNC